MKITIFVLALTSALLGSFVYDVSARADNSPISSIETLALDVAILYGETDPRISPILKVLGITDAASLEKFINDNTSGNGISSILNFLVVKSGSTDSAQNDWPAIAYQYASTHSEYSSWLQSQGINSPSDLEARVQSGSNSSNLSLNLIGMGLAYLIFHQSMSDSVPSFLSDLNLGAYQGLSLSDISQVAK